MNFLIHLMSVVCLFTTIGTVVSNLLLFRHLETVKKKIDIIFEGKSDEEIYQFVYGGGDVKTTETDVENVENEG